MANYATLISAIQSVITANGNNEITGPILQQTLVSIINSLGSGYQFIGIATPQTTPGTPDQKVFYIGSAGTYPNFGPAVIPDGNLAVFYYDSSWHYGSVAFPLGDNAVSTSKIQNSAVTEQKLATSLIQKLLNDGFVYAGIATPNTNPGTPDKDCFYFAQQVGTYSNFGLSVADGQLAIFKYSNLSWSKDTINIPISVLNGNQSTPMELVVDDGSVMLRILGGSLTLDSPAYEGKTYRQIFETNNWFGISPGFENGSFSPLYANAGSPSVQSAEKDSGSYALKASGTTSQQVRTSGNTTAKGFAACRVKVTSYTAGYCGMQFDNIAGVSEVTDWVTKVVRKTSTTQVAAFIGSISSASLTGYIDTPVVVLNSVFSTVPSVEQFEQLYNTYVQLKKEGTVPQVSQTIYLLTSDGAGARFVNNGSSGDMTLAVTGDDVELTVDDSTATLDSIAYDGLTYRQIFETNNALGISSGFENGSYSPLVVNTGSPTIQSTEKDSGTYALMASGTSSQQVKTSATNITAPAFIACRAKVTSYTAGYCGVQYSSAGSVGAQGVTDWETFVGQRASSGSGVGMYVGSFSSANLTGYIDTPVVVMKSIFSTPPTLSQFTQLYNNYVSLKKGIPIAGARTVKLQVVKNYEFTDAECKNAFIAAMNAKAQQIGALTAHFSDASGLVYTDAQASANDILQILVHAAGMERIAEKWSRKSYAMTIYGSNARTENITSSVQNTTYYDDTANPILGGKTGTLTTSGQVTYNLMFCTIASGIEVAIAIIGASSEANRWTDAQKIVTYLTKILNGESATLASLNASYAAACKLPNNPIMYDNFPFTLLVSKSPSTLGKRPASLTKVMTLVAAYDYITDENEFITIKSSDLIGGSGANIAAGDVVSIRDLVFDMLLPSSNNAATAIARYCGYKILKQQTIGNE